MRTADPLRHVLHQVEQALGPVTGSGAPIHGTAPGHRLRLDVAGIGPVVLKAADGTDEAARAVGAEVALLQHVRSPHMPVVLAGDPLDPVPWMVQRDLGADGWPPPWPARMAPVWRAVRRLHRLAPPPWLVAVDDVDPWDADRPDPDSPHALREAAARVSIAGDDLVHGDLGGDNLHVRGRRVTVIDWSDAFVGAGEIDLLSIAIDLAHTEGRRVAPPVDDLAAWMAKSAGLLSAAAARPPWPTPGGAQVRAAQRALARTATDWAVELLT